MFQLHDFIFYFQNFFIHFIFYHRATRDARSYVARRCTTDGGTNRYRSHLTEYIRRPRRNGREYKIGKKKNDLPFATLANFLRRWDIPHIRNNRRNRYPRHAFTFYTILFSGLSVGVYEYSFFFFCLFIFYSYLFIPIW